MKHCRASKKMARFMLQHFVSELTLNGDPCEGLAKFVWADFPSSLGVKLVDVDTVPAWNHFSEDLCIAASQLASKYTADQGWFVTCSIAEHFPAICAAATSAGFCLHLSLTLIVDKGYMRTDIHVEVRKCF